MGKIRVQDLARMMKISKQDLVFKLKSVGVRVEGDDPSIDTDIIQAILQGKKIPRPREVILRDEPAAPTPVSDPARRRAPAPAAPPVRRPAVNPLRPNRPRTLIQKVEPRLQTLPASIPSAPAIDINPQPLSAGEKPRKVFISYAWGDETSEGKIRAKVVDTLYSALTEDGFLPVRDRDQIRPGKRISAFIRRLTRADLVVAVISDKYLRSPYCMIEIYRLWQKCQGDVDDLSQRLVPIVLPEVKVGSIRERLPYLEHWADQADSLEALIRNQKLRLSAESWEEVRLVREFAHHVDGILVFLQDVLMPRKLEVHLDDGFQAVREALRRRMGVGG